MKTTMNFSISACVAAIVVLAPLAARAQAAPGDDVVDPGVPDPFSGLEPAPSISNTPLPSRDSATFNTATSRFGVGQWTLGGLLLGSYTATTNEVSGKQEPASTFFLRAVPTLGYFVADQLELRVGTGLLLRQLFRSQDDVALEGDFTLDVGVNYYIPLGERFNLHTGAAIGAYVGQSDRDVRIGSKDIVEKTTTWGGLGSANFGAGYVVADRVQINADVVATGMVGLESISTEPDALFASTFNLGVALGVTYAF